MVVTHGGREITGKKALAWAKEAADRGAGEILLTSMEHDGAKTGFATDITKLISSGLSIPVIASGGAGEVGHFSDVFRYADVDGALAASVFHSGHIAIPALKQVLDGQGIEVRRGN